MPPLCSGGHRSSIIDTCMHLAVCVTPETTSPLCKTPRVVSLYIEHPRVLLPQCPRCFFAPSPHVLRFNSCLAGRGHGFRNKEYRACEPHPISPSIDCRRSFMPTCRRSCRPRLQSRRRAIKSPRWASTPASFSDGLGHSGPRLPLKHRGCRSTIFIVVGA